MRTTLNIDDDILDLAKSLAAGQKISVGEALSQLARRGVASHTPLVFKNGFCVFAVDESTPQFGPEDVEKALEAEDLEYASFFLNPKRDP